MDEGIVDSCRETPAFTKWRLELVELCAYVTANARGLLGQNRGFRVRVDPAFSWRDAWALSVFLYAPCVDSGIVSPLRIDHIILWADTLIPPRMLIERKVREAWLHELDEGLRFPDWKSPHTPQPRDTRFDLTIIDDAPVRLSAEQVEAAFLDGELRDVSVTFIGGSGS